MGTSPRLIGVSIVEQLTLWPEDFLVSRTAWPETVEDWLTLEETWPLSSLGFPGKLTQSGSSERTCPDFFPLQKGEISRPSSRRWQTFGLGGASLGGFWTLSSCEYPVGEITERLSDGSVRYHSAAAVSFLSSTLETGDVPQRYMLSSRACSGILNRAARRGRQLPPMLEEALRSVVED